MTQSFDIILYGASSFVGQILTAHIQQLNVSGLRWAIAGRSETKLKDLKKKLHLTKIPHMIADSNDEASLRKMVLSTKTVLSTVGPYALYGETLVKVCCEEGRNYCDLTGEPQWIYDMIQRYEDKAKASGAKIVHCCGFDSIPSDIGLLQLQNYAKAQTGSYCQRVDFRLKDAGGGVSGGTVASLLNVAKETRHNPQLRKLLGNPHALCSKPEGKARQNNINTVEYDRGINEWLAPFIMAGINTKIIHRSHELSGTPYGEDFMYSEAVMVGKGPLGAIKSVATTGAMVTLMISGFFDSSRWLLQKFLPKAGHGPSPESQKNGFYDIRFYGYLKGSEKSAITLKLTGDMDPGYGSTAKLLAQAGLSLTFDQPVLDKPGGFWTPASLMGEDLRERLESHAGLKFSII